KEVERLQTAELAKSNIQRPFIRFDVTKPSGRHPFEVKDLSKAYEGATGKVQVFKDFAATMARGEKIALIGRNGAGKTTLLKSLIRNATGFVEPSHQKFPIDSGKVTWGHEVTVGYFAQDHRESIPEGLTVIEWLHSF